MGKKKTGQIYIDADDRVPKSMRKQIYREHLAAEKKKKSAYKKRQQDKSKGLTAEWKAAKALHKYPRQVGKWEGPFSLGALWRGARGKYFLEKNGRKYPRYLSIASVGRYSRFSSDFEPKGELGKTIQKWRGSTRRTEKKKEIKSKWWRIAVEKKKKKEAEEKEEEKRHEVEDTPTPKQKKKWQFDWDKQPKQPIDKPLQDLSEMSISEARQKLDEVGVPKSTIKKIFDKWKKATTAAKKRQAIAYFEKIFYKYEAKDQLAVDPSQHHSIHDLPLSAKELKRKKKLLKKTPGKAAQFEAMPGTKAAYDKAVRASKYDIQDIDDIFAPSPVKRKKKKTAREIEAEKWEIFEPDDLFEPEDFGVDNIGLPETPKKPITTTHRKKFMDLYKKLKQNKVYQGKKKNRKKDIAAYHKLLQKYSPSPEQTKHKGKRVVAKKEYTLPDGKKISGKQLQGLLKGHKKHKGINKSATAATRKLLASLAKGRQKRMAVPGAKSKPLAQHPRFAKRPNSEKFVERAQHPMNQPCDMTK